MSTPPTYVRTPRHVWRICGGSVLVMGPDAVAHQLDGAASIVWAELDQPTDVTTLVARSGDRWVGAHGEPADLATEAIELLVGAGLVREVGA